MLQDGLGDTPGPAPGCEAAPSASWGVTTTFPGSVNAANLARGLTVRGIATGATAVNVELRDGTAPVVTKAATGTNNWSVSFTRAQLRSLNGNVRVVGRYAFNGGTITGKTSSFLKDTVRPNAPRASLRQGTYQRPRRTALRTAAGNTIRYTVGAGRQARPTATRGAVYRGRIRLAAPKQVIKAVAVDRAGNVSAVKRLVYRIR
jgi:Chitobiase/beta-hexosaminidase C-terminal domain